MENWFGLFLALLSFTCLGRALDTCSVPETQKSYVTALAISMGRKVGPCVPPDPSVLLALNLGPVKDPTAREMLIEQLQKDAVHRVSNNQTFSSGKAALYVLALRSSCVDPRNILVQGTSIDLVQILEDKTREELRDFESCPPVPDPSLLTTWYQIGLDILGLCAMSRPYAVSAAHTLANHMTVGIHGSVDTAAVAAMGLTCVTQMDDVPGETSSAVTNTLLNLLKYMSEQQNEGLIGNAYSTGLAAQALKAAQAHYALESWDCPGAIQKVISLIPQNTFSAPISAAQLLPFLWEKSYVSVKDVQCPHDAHLISVGFTIVNDLIQEHFSHSTIVQVSEGSTLLKVMQKAAELDSSKFSFESEESSWGTYVTSINNLKGSTTDKTYWQFLSGTTPLAEGVSSYKPKHNENIIAAFSKY